MQFHQEVETERQLQAQLSPVTRQVPVSGTIYGRFSTDEGALVCAWCVRQKHPHLSPAPYSPEDSPSAHGGLGPLHPRGVLPVSQEDMFTACRAVAPQRPGSKRIENVITTVFISKRTAGSLLLSIWRDPDGYS